MINKERNAKVYDLIKEGKPMKEIAIIMGDNASKITAIKNKINNNNIEREYFINNYSSHLRRESYKELKKEIKFTIGLCEPKYSIGDIVNTNFLVINVYKDTKNRYLTKNLLYKYKTMFFEDDIKEECSITNRRNGGING